MRVKRDVCHLPLSFVTPRQLRFHRCRRDAYQILYHSPASRIKIAGSEFASSKEDDHESILVRRSILERHAVRGDGERTPEVRFADVREMIGKFLKCSRGIFAPASQQPTRCAGHWLAEHSFSLENKAIYRSWNKVPAL